jgi:hypothetical protein
MKGGLYVECNNVDNLGVGFNVVEALASLQREKGRKPSCEV